jgi:hypothetical protein
MNAERHRKILRHRWPGSNRYTGVRRGIPSLGARYKYHAAATATITPQFLNLTIATSSNFPPPSAHMPPERLAGYADRLNTFPRFPFVDITLRSPRTPIQNSQTSSLQDAARTHPIDDPFYPSPFYGLSFGATGSGALAREGALVPLSLLTGPSFPSPPSNGSPEAREITYFEGWFPPVFRITSMGERVSNPVDIVLIPGIGNFRGSRFRSIDVGSPKDGVYLST